MKLTKLTLVALVLALMVCAFAACGGDTPAVTEGDDVAPNTEAAPATDAETEPAGPVECQHTNTTEEIEEPTCESRGYKRVLCAGCGEQVSVKPIDAVDHEAAAPATCTEGSVCKFCGLKMASATGHTMGAITDKKEATATEAGYEKGTCSACGIEMNKVIPAGITVTFDDAAEGALTKDAFAAFEGFETLLPASGFTVVTEGDNTYVKKSNARNTITFKDLDGVLGQGKFAFSMDVRFDGATSNSGLIAFKDATEATAEHRILSTWGGRKLRLGKDPGVDFYVSEENAWFNVRVVVDPSTFDYEVWIDGEKVLYTTADANVASGHLLWQLVDGEWVSGAVPNAFVTQGITPDPSVGISRIYLFHWSETAMSLDNMKIEYIPEA